MAKDSGTQDAQNEEDDDLDTEASGDGTSTIKFKSSVKADKAVDGVEREINLTLTVPSSVDGWKTKYGEDLVLALLRNGLVSRARAYTRTMVEGETVKAEDGTESNKFYSDEEIQEAVNSYKPSLTRGRQGASKGEKLVASLDTMSTAELEAVRARLVALGLA